MKNRKIFPLSVLMVLVLIIGCEEQINLSGTYSGEANYTIDGVGFYTTTMTLTLTHDFVYLDGTWTLAAGTGLPDMEGTITGSTQEILDPQMNFIHIHMMPITSPCGSGFEHGH